MDPSTSSDAAAAAAAGIWTIFSTLCCFAYLIPIGLGVVGMVLWIIAIIDVAQRKESEFPHAIKGTPSSNEQIIWLLVVVLTGIIGAIIYWIVVMRPYPRAREGSAIALTPPTPPAAAPPVVPAAPAPPAPSAPPSASPAAQPPVDAVPPAEPAPPDTPTLPAE
jgi:hypothetical protein